MKVSTRNHQNVLILFQWANTRWRRSREISAVRAPMPTCPSRCLESLETQGRRNSTTPRTTSKRISELLWLILIRRLRMIYPVCASMSFFIDWLINYSHNIQTCVFARPQGVGLGQAMYSPEMRCLCKQNKAKSFAYCIGIAHKYFIYPWSRRWLLSCNCDLE